MDFVSDQPTNGRRLKCLAETDDYSNEAVLIAVDVAMPARENGLRARPCYRRTASEADQV